MSRDPSTFRQLDVKAAIKAVVDVSYEVAPVEIGAIADWLDRLP
jgi:hypothetical protein